MYNKMVHNIHAPPIKANLTDCCFTQSIGGYDLFCFKIKNNCIARTRKKRLTIKQIVVIHFTFLPPCLMHMHVFTHHEYNDKVKLPSADAFAC